MCVCVCVFFCFIDAFVLRITNTLLRCRGWEVCYYGHFAWITPVFTFFGLWFYLFPASRCSLTVNQDPTGQSELFIGYWTREDYDTSVYNTPEEVRVTRRFFFLFVLSALSSYKRIICRMAMLAFGGMPHQSRTISTVYGYLVVPCLSLEACLVL